MRTKLTLTTMLLVLAIGALWSVQVGAYGVFTADPPEASNCSQCHTDWPGATHTVHQAFDCSACHANDPVQTNSCAGCHDAGDLLDLHSPLEGLGDMAYCGYCHAGVGTEKRNLGEMKALFQ